VRKLSRYECDRLIVEVSDLEKRVIIKPNVVVDPKEMRMLRAGCPDKECKDKCILRR